MSGPSGAWRVGAGLALSVGVGAVATLNLGVMPQLLAVEAGPSPTVVPAEPNVEPLLTSAVEARPEGGAVATGVAPTPEPAAVPEPEPVKQPEPEPEPVKQPKPVTEPAAAAVPVPVPAVTAAPEAVPEPEPAVPEPVPEPAVAAVPEPVKQPEPEPVKQPTEAGTLPAGRPAGDPALVVRFDLERASLSDTARADLIALVAALRKDAAALYIECSTDGLGASWYNDRLAKNRCYNVRALLLSYGVKRADIELVPLGESARATTPDGADVVAPELRVARIWRR